MLMFYWYVSFINEYSRCTIILFLNLLSGYQHIRMYDINSGDTTPIINYEGIPKNVTSVGFQEEGKWMFTGGEDCTARIWDLRWVLSLT